MKDEIEVANIMDIIDTCEHRTSSKLLDDPRVEMPNGVVVSSPLEIDLPNSKEDVAAAVSIFKEQYKDYLGRYNIKVDFRVEDIFSNLEDLIDPTKREIFRLSLNETIDSIRLIGLSKLAIALLVTLKKTTDPAFINSLDPVQAVGYTDKIFSQLEKISKLKGLLNVKDSNTEMTQIMNKINNEGKPQVSMVDESKIMAILKDLDSKK